MNYWTVSKIISHHRRVIIAGQCQDLLQVVLCSSPYIVMVVSDSVKQLVHWILAL